MSSEFGPSSCTTSSVSLRPCAEAKRGARAVIPARPRPPSTPRRFRLKDDALMGASHLRDLHPKEARRMPSIHGVACCADLQFYGVTAPRLTARGAVSSFQVELATCTGENAGRST